ncbi:hypothetical protein PF005_g6315 [Phytophthora fragariae]|uniref:C2H2-type domain-containing protein n=1 Tax=Phytophthora fragariae TaxID=53985 RepID=A0A6A4EKZ3_9STRA|nr:hypothetical protein PF003_g16523 [Phytophthora fragariae]KAE8943264.1 hypothetical protein PF009_g7002 [Phytophthora fragariae]KAE9125032.1 hypothetical protein PF010_g5776 [Phytophthora fragariae]KAE9125102.1 hypothetical protein PF007_g6471 [Phytophthora fragariae]KAE9150235.1 hypothetical protein PF006_g5363 [Phytophthora fragariae]
MGSYYMEDAHLYSGYDEYAGSFGPLRASSSSTHRSRGRAPPTRRGFSDARNLDISSRLRRGRKAAPRDFDRRAKFLAKRQAKRASEPLGGGSDGGEDLHDKENEPVPTHGLQQQVWLPTRNFAFRQRAGKLDTRAIARLDLEKIAATTDIETIQRHLENLAFADVTLDDVQHYSDAYFLKLFQIAQLTLEYLMHVQDSLVDHSEGQEKQCEQLMTECQQLETENGQHETEIASLKREIRQKQRTMATLELMLLNASAANRTSSSAKENAAREANALVDELLANRTDPNVTEEGSITNPVSCFLCDKRFVSAEYLLRHQQRRHQDAKGQKKQKKKKDNSSSGSGSDSDSKVKRDKKPALLPKEVLDALKEKNQLAKQLLALQDQVRHDEEARDRQRLQLEHQQNQVSSRVEQYMEKLQTTLVEIEKKQEATKQDLRQYTQEAIARLQVEAANAELLRIQTQKTSRAGRMENDDDGSQTEAKLKSEEARWSEKVEKLMDTFLRAQAQKQQEIDALEQESNKLWAKYTKLKKKKQHRPEPTMMLADITALDANRFGIDRGEVVDIETPMPVQENPSALLEDTLIQTDEEDDSQRFKREPKVDTLSEEVQTDSETKATPVAPVIVPPIRIEAVQRIPVEQAPPAPKEDTAPVVSPPPVVEAKESSQSDPTVRFQQAAHVIGKVALGFLARRALAKTSNWRITIAISSLETALTAPELEYARHRYDDQVQVQVEEEMTANDLRVLIAKVLSGKDEFVAANGVVAFDNNDDELTATMTYHRVLLQHKRTGVELSGDMKVHTLKNAIEVEIIPFYEEAVAQIGEVIESHAMITDRIEDIRRASLTLSSSILELQDEEEKSKSSSRDGMTAFVRIIKLQALVRGFLAKKKVELMKIDRLVDARLVKMEAGLRTESFGPKILEPSWMSLDPVLAAEYAKVEQRLAQVLREKLRGDSQQAEENAIYLSTANYDKHVAELEAEQNSLPVDAQRRVQLLTERLPPMAVAEYNRRQSEAGRQGKSRIAGAAKIHRAVQVEVVRKRLRRLLSGEAAQIAGSKSPAATNALLSSWLAMSKDNRRASDKSLGGFDLREIDQLANAYEEGKSPDEIPKPKVQDDTARVLTISFEAVECKEEEEKAQVPQPLTPRVEHDDVEPADEMKSTGRPGTPNPYAEANRELMAEAGRSPRPNPGIHVISPFSQTPLLSRRAAARRGNFDNAR